MSNDSLTSDQLVGRICPDCGTKFRTANPSPEEVCEPCFEAFNGMTIEELCGAEGKSRA